MTAGENCNTHARAGFNVVAKSDNASESCERGRSLERPARLCGGAPKSKQGKKLKGADGEWNKSPFTRKGASRGVQQSSTDPINLRGAYLSREDGAESAALPAGDGEFRLPPNQLVGQPRLCLDRPVAHPAGDAAQGQC